MKIDLARYLGVLAGQDKIVYCPNPGNAGDSLIAYATFQLFEQLGISCEPYAESSFQPNGTTLIYGGGGSLTPDSRFSWGLIKRHHASVKKLIVLPQTICGNEDLLGRLGSNVDLIAREAVSFEYVKQKARGAQVWMADDLAFRLNADRILAADLNLWSTLLSRPFPVKRMLREGAVWLRVIAGRSVRRHGPRVLHCFRTDRERTDIHRPIGNVDVSKIFKYGVATPEQAFCTTHMVLRLLAQYDEVRTNRLHMAIAGALLGKTVKFHPNNYYKCEAVYCSSMKDRYPNVQWMGTGGRHENR